MVKEDSHTRATAEPARSRHLQTSFGVPQHKVYLFACHAREPLQEIIDPRAVFKVLEQCPDRHARSLEQPFAAAFSGHAFHLRTLAPIEHDAILWGAQPAGKREAKPA